MQAFRLCAKRNNGRNKEARALCIVLVPSAPERAAEDSGQLANRRQTIRR